MCDEDEDEYDGRQNEVGTLDDRVSVTNPAGTNSMRDDAPQATAPTNSMGCDTPQASAGASKSGKAKHSSHVAISKDGNPLGWLAHRRIASGHGFERSN